MKPLHWFSALVLAGLGLGNSLLPARAADPPSPPIVLVVASDPSAAEESSDPATFLVVRTGSADTSLTVQYALGGQALNGTDYELLPGAVTIPPGAWFAPVTVTPREDSLIEGSESVVLALQQPPQWPPPYIVTWPSVAFAEIADNDFAPTNRPPHVALLRPPDGAIFEADDVVPLVARAFDLDGRVRTVEFFDGNRSLAIVTNRPILPNPLPLSTAEDPVFALAADFFPDFDLNAYVVPVPVPGQFFRWLWTDPLPGTHVLTALATDNDGATARSLPVSITVLPGPSVPLVTIRAVDPVASEPDPATNVLDTATFRVQRTGPTNLPLQVHFSIDGTASNGIDYRPLPRSLLIPAGARGIDVVVEPLDDLLVEGVETVILTLLPPLTGVEGDPPTPDCYRVDPSHSAKAIIRDNDTPPNRPPVVRLIKPQEGDLFMAPADIRLVAFARDFDGYVSAVEFFEGTRSLGIVTNSPVPASVVRPPFSLVWSNVPPGRYVLTAVATDNDGAATPSRPVEIKVLPQVPLPEVNLLTLDAEAAETLPTGVANPAVFSVTRTGSTRLPLLVFYSISGSASNGIDYRPLTGRVLVPAGAISNNIMVEPMDDNLVEDAESVVLKLELPPASSPDPTLQGYCIGSNRMGKAIIRDNDSNLPPKLAIVEPQEEAVFSAYSDIEIDVLACDPDGWVSKVQFYADGRLIGQQEMVFIVAPPPGQPQRFSMIWSNVPPGLYELTAKATDSRGAGAVSDPVRIKVTPVPAVPVVTIQAIDPVASEPSPLLPVEPDTALFKVSRAGSLSNALTVFYRVSGTASNGLDYRPLPGFVTLPAHASAAEIKIVPLDDSLVEGTESVIITLNQLNCVTSNGFSADCYLAGDPSRVIAFIRDNDAPPNKPPTVAIVSPPTGALFSAPVDVRLVAAAADPDGWVATVEFFDGTNSLGVVTNHPWILNADHCHLLDLGADVVLDHGPTSPFVLVWSNAPPGQHVLTAVATDNVGDSTRSRPIEITVLDPSHLPVVTLTAPDPIAWEGATNTAAFRVRRVGATNLPLTVFYSIRGTAENGVDYAPIPASVTIPAGQRTAHILIEPIDDNLRERVETVLLRLCLPPVGPATYQIGHPARAGAIILDNDWLLPGTRNLPDGNLHVRLPLTPGLPFHLEASTDLVNWEPVVADTATESGVSFIEDDAAGYPRRFFRVVQEFGDLDTD